MSARTLAASGCPWASRPSRPTAARASPVATASSSTRRGPAAPRKVPGSGGVRLAASQAAAAKPATTTTAAPSAPPTAAAASDECASGPTLAPSEPAANPAAAAAAAAPPPSRLTLAGMAGVAAAGGPTTPAVSSPPPPLVPSTSGQGAGAGAGAASPATPLMATLLVQCPDAQGVVAALAQLLAGLGCNITASDQHTDPEAGAYFQRIRFDYSSMVVGPANTAVLEASIAGTAARFAMDFGVFYDAKPKRIAIFVSKAAHCLWDLLIRSAAGDLPRGAVVAVISNHPDLEPVAATFGIPFFVVPSSAMGDEAGKAAQEAAIEGVLSDTGADLLVLARWMNVFSPAFCGRHAAHTINIHHGFLPAFQGARPYHQAHARGVKVIGSSAHFATARLDEGPLIEQVRRREGGGGGGGGGERDERGGGGERERGGGREEEGDTRGGCPRPPPPHTHTLTRPPLPSPLPLQPQDVVRISHRDTPADMVRKGRDLERLVLARAVRAVLEDRVLVQDTKTVVFDE